MTSSGRVHNLFQNADGKRHILFEMMHDAAHHSDAYTPAPQPFFPAATQRVAKQRQHSAPKLMDIRPMNVDAELYSGATQPVAGKIRVVDRNSYVDTDFRRKYVSHRAPSLYHEPRMNRGHIYEKGVQDFSFQAPRAAYTDIDPQTTQSKQIPQLYMLTQYTERRDSRKVRKRRRNRQSLR